MLRNPTRRSVEFSYPMACTDCGGAHGYPQSARTRPGYVDVQIYCRSCAATWTVSRPDLDSDSPFPSR